MWGVCAGVRVYVFARRQPKVTFHKFCTLFWNKVSAGLELTKKARQADQWAPIGLPVSISTVLEEQAYTTKPAFKKHQNIVLVVVFQGKHSSSWAIFPTLVLVLPNCHVCSVYVTLVMNTFDFRSERTPQPLRSLPTLSKESSNPGCSMNFAYWVRTKLVWERFTVLTATACGNQPIPTV